MHVKPQSWQSMKNENVTTTTSTARCGPLHKVRTAMVVACIVSPSLCRTLSVLFIIVKLQRRGHLLHLPTSLLLSSTSSEPIAWASTLIVGGTRPPLGLYRASSRTDHTLWDVRRKELVGTAEIRFVFLSCLSEGFNVLVVASALRNDGSHGRNAVLVCFPKIAVLDFALRCFQRFAPDFFMALRMAVDSCRRSIQTALFALLFRGKCHGLNIERTVKVGERTSSNTYRVSKISQTRENLDVSFREVLRVHSNDTKKPLMKLMNHFP